MIGRIHLKRTIKRTAGCLAVAGRPFLPSETKQRACILVYHRIADIGFVDPRRDDWNVPPSLFQQQIEAIAGVAEIVSLECLAERLRSEQAPERPLVCLTFDDGFANFYHQALPILERYNASATLFVPTESIGRREPMTFDRWASDNRHRVSADVWRAVTWEELQRCVDSKHVTVGSHSHQHLNGVHCSADQFAEEAGRSREILASRFGIEKIDTYAYPYGSRRLGQVPEAYVQAVRDAGYRLALTTDLGLADAASDPLALPRVEAHPMDSPAVIRAKVSGSLSPYRFTDRLRKGHRA